MSEQVYDALLKRMGEIASAVNAFKSEAVQVEAFAALVTALNGGRGTHPSHPASGASGERVSQTDTKSKPELQPKRRKREGGGDFAVVKDLNLRPKDKVSFADFVAQKQPKSNEEKYVVAIYYLEQILGLSAVTVDHVGTVFRLTATWREPAALAAGLRMTAARKGTIDTGDQNKIKTTPQGRNFVEHDLPVKPKSK